MVHNSLFQLPALCTCIRLPDAWERHLTVGRCSCSHFSWGASEAWHLQHHLAAAGCRWGGGAADLCRDGPEPSMECQVACLCKQGQSVLRFSQVPETPSPDTMVTKRRRDAHAGRHGTKAQKAVSRKLLWERGSCLQAATLFALDLQELYKPTG